MRVEFASSHLERCYQRSSEAVCSWGTIVGRRYIQRVGILLAVSTFSDLYTVRSLRLHPLKGGRVGQHSLILIDRWRLIVTDLPDERTVRVDEVSNHYDD